MESIVARATPPGFGQIREPSFYVGLTHGVVSHSRPPPSRSPGGLMIPTTLHCLLVAALITVEGLDHVILKPKQLDGVVAVNVDEVLGHVAMALSKKS
jgi:hypothetical protein